MGEGVEGGGTCRGGILQQIFEKINHFWTHLSTENLNVRNSSERRGEKVRYPVERMRFDLREFVFHVIRVHGPYLFFGWCSEDFDNFHQLINPRFSRE